MSLMTRTRTFLIASFCLVAAGVVAAVAARGTDAARSGLLPAEASILPADASLVVGVDVARLVSSPLYQRLIQTPGFNPPDVWTELQQHAGLRPEHDFRQFILAAEGRTNGAVLGLLLGSFERSRLDRALGGVASLTRRERKGRTMWITKPTPAQKESALAVLEDGLLVAGTVDAVGAALERRSEGGQGLLGNAPLLALVQQVKPSATVWACGNQGLFAATVNVSPAAAGWNIPSLKTVVASADLAPDLDAVVQADSDDDASAKTMSGMLQGMLGLLTMQAGTRTELKELVSGIDVRQTGAQVNVRAHLRYDTLFKLLATPPPPATPTTARPSK